ncbi:MAG: hypothetical protein JNM69_02660, partial [Archangium sp.]|nr:hypothetical protein [Archangium sp.]
MRWAFFAFALLLSCGTKPPCDRTSCSIGCCDSRGLCVSGLSDSACGERGAACEACPSSSVCQAGRCGALSGAGGGSAFFDAGSPDAGVQLGSACAQLGFFCFNPSTALEC